MNQAICEAEKLNLEILNETTEKILKSLCWKPANIREDIKDKFADDNTFLEVLEIVKEWSGKIAK